MTKVILNDFFIETALWYPLLGTLLGELPSLVFVASAVTLSLSNATTPVTDLVH